MADRDIDFDELDRVVSNHIEDGGQISNKTSTDKVHSTSTPITEPPVLKPRVGRFMDVMHPSADMRSSSRSHNRSASKNHKHKKHPREKKAHLPPAWTDNTPAPSLTPFLPDANEKVEKRPLGGSVQPVEATLNNVEQEKIQDAPQKSLGISEQIVTPANEAEKKPVEALGNPEDHASNDNSFEAVDPQLPANPDMSKTSQSPEEKRLQEIESQEVTEPISEFELDAEDQATSSDIIDDSVQDSSEKDNTETKPQNSIYDVKEYHQPIQHKEKQKSGWLVVIIIITIIVLTALLAAAGYYYYLNAGA